MQPAKQEPSILLAEDDADVRTYLEMAVRCLGYSVLSADCGEEALDLLSKHSGIAAVLMDIVMPRKDGLETLKEIRRAAPGLPVIMVSGASSPLNIVEAMKNGATDFLPKPVSHADLRKVLRSVLEPRPRLSETPAPAAGANVFFGYNQRMIELRGLLPQVGWSEAPALLLGETGVGKEVIARELHAQSPRSKKAFLKVNCAALPSELVESELFGYERGAFTGAVQKKPGMFELADGGTIFLDEIGDMDFKLQAKLLQVLQDSEFTRLGGRETVHVDVRVIAATHNNLEDSIAGEKFREDLYYRLSVITLNIPPLRERKEDLLPLAEFLLARHARGGAIPLLTPRLRDAITAYSWPGNVRELENVMRRLLILQNPDLIAVDLTARASRAAAPAAAAASTSGPAFVAASDTVNKNILEQVTCAKNQAERTAILTALESTHWNRKKAAMILKIDYKALLYKMKKLGIEDRMAALPAQSGQPEPPAAAPGESG